MVRKLQKKSFKKHKKNKLNFKRLGVLVFIMLSLVFISFKLMGQYQKIYALNEQISSLEKDIESARENQIEIRNRQKYYQSDEYKEKVAREKFGLVFPDEKLYVID